MGQCCLYGIRRLRLSHALHPHLHHSHSNPRHELLRAWFHVNQVWCSTNYGFQSSGCCIRHPLGSHATTVSPALFVGTILHAMVKDVRTARLVAIYHLVIPERRISTLAVHFLMSPLGTVFGPVAWLAIDRYVPYYLLSATCILGVSALACTIRDLLDINR